MLNDTTRRPILSFFFFFDTVAVDNALLKFFTNSKTLKSAAASAVDLAPKLPMLVSRSCLLLSLCVFNI